MHDSLCAKQTCVQSWYFILTLCCCNVNSYLVCLHLIMKKISKNTEKHVKEHRHTDFILHVILQWCWRWLRVSSSSPSRLRMCWRWRNSSCLTSLYCAITTRITGGRLITGFGKREMHKMICLWDGIKLESKCGLHRIWKLSKTIYLTLQTNRNT